MMRKLTTLLFYKKGEVIMNGKMYLEPTYLVYKPAEVIEKLGLGSTQGYEKINNLFVANTSEL